MYSDTDLPVQRKREPFLPQVRPDRTRLSAGERGERGRQRTDRQTWTGILPLDVQRHRPTCSAKAYEPSWYGWNQIGPDQTGPRTERCRSEADRPGWATDGQARPRTRTDTASNTPARTRSDFQQSDSDRSSAVVLGLPLVGSLTGVTSVENSRTWYPAGYYESQTRRLDEPTARMSYVSDVHHLAGDIKHLSRNTATRSHTWDLQA